MRKHFDSKLPTTHRRFPWNGAASEAAAAVTPGIPASADDPQARANALRKTLDNRNKVPQYAAFAQQVPLAHVVRIPHATHYVFQSNEVDVLREMNTFIATLPPAN